MNRVFYGWITLGAIFLIYASGTIGVSTLPLVNAQLKDQFGWTHEQLTYAPSLLFLMMALMSPFAGALLDKLNPKRILLFGWLCFVVALVVYSTLSSLWQFALAYGIYSIGSVCTGVIPGMYLISKWFKKRRGIATGIFTVGSSFGGLIFPRLAAYWLGDGYSWRETALLLAVATAACAALPWFFVRNFPEDVGATVDGLPLEPEEISAVSVSPSQASRSAPPSQPAITPVPQSTGGMLGFGELFGSLTFYLILFITAAVWFCVTPMVQHLAFHMKDLKIDIMTSATVLQVLFACSIVGKLTFGWASSYGDKKLILLVATLCMAGGSFIVLLTTPERLNNELFLYGAAFVYGIGFSGSFTMVQLLVAEQYNKHAAFGKILGAVAMFDSLAGVTGIYALGQMRTLLGNYTAAFTMLTVMGLCAAAGVIALKTRETIKTKFA